ncbi:MAG: hypothetical protein NTW73_01915 [Candidatus Parcubacteria bacterium]|nr:hypothetical protein [Candidatus Parcubacteria bacterium]
MNIISAINDWLSYSRMVETFIKYPDRDNYISLGESGSPRCDVDQDTTKALVWRRIASRYCEDAITDLEWIGPLKVSGSVIWLNLDHFGTKWTISQVE